MTSSRASRWSVLVGAALLVGIVALGAASGADAADDRVTVSAGGYDDGTTTQDTIRVTGTPTRDWIRITEGLSCDVRRCWMRIEAVKDIAVGGVCRLKRINIVLTDPKIAFCPYFKQDDGSRKAIVDLEGGSDELIVQQTDLGVYPTGALRWKWEVDYGGGDDLIEGDHYRIPGEQYLTRNVIKGGAGDDRFHGTWPEAAFDLLGDDVVVNIVGDDTFAQIAGGGGLSISGGGGDDTLTATTILAFRGGAGNDSAAVEGGSGGSSLLDGGPGDDTLTGGSGSERLLGGDGDDRLVPRGGVDREVDGGAGDDTIDLGRGLDDELETIRGGAGVDTVVYGSVPVRVLLDGTEPSTGRDTLVGIENATGSTRADTIVGTTGPNTIRSGGGVGDSISGLDGNDRIYVVDAVSGTGSDDIVYAGAGEDTVYADDGRTDSISCGAGYHSETTTINGNPVTILRAPDVDRVRADGVDVLSGCELRI